MILYIHIIQWRCVLMWWETLSTLQQAMFIIACALTALLVVQIVMMFVGAAQSGGDGLTEMGGAGDVGDVGDIGDVGDAGDVGDIGDADADVGGGDDPDLSGGMGGGALFGMKLLSLRSILAFFVMFAWLCYTMCFFVDWYIALIISIAGGMAAACGMAGALVAMEKLQDNGMLVPENAVGKIGTVYLTIPPSRSGRGKVNILVQERYAEYEAVTDSDEPLPTGSAIKVIKHDGGNVLLVKKYTKPAITIVNE